MERLHQVDPETAANSGVKQVIPGSLIGENKFYRAFINSNGVLINRYVSTPGEHKARYRFEIPPDSNNKSVEKYLKNLNVVKILKCVEKIPYGHPTYIYILYVIGRTKSRECMELLLNGHQVALFKKIIALFKQLTQSVYFNSTESGLELSSLNSSNTAWLQIFFASSFFNSYTHISNSRRKESKGLLSSKNLYNSLTLPDNILTKKNLNHLSALDTCLITSEEDSDVLSFSLNLCDGLICRTTSISFEDTTIQFPEDINWSDYNYFRFSPQLILKCIYPYCFSEDDIIWYVNPQSNLIEVRFLSSHNIPNKSFDFLESDCMSSAFITLDPSQFEDLSIGKLEDKAVGGTDNIFSIFSIKQLVAVANIADSLNLPIALVFKDLGEPAFTLFGRAAHFPSKKFNQSQSFNSSELHYFSSKSKNRESDLWSGALWMSTIVSENFKQHSLVPNISIADTGLSIPSAISSQSFHSIYKLSVRSGESDQSYRQSDLKSQSDSTEPNLFESQDRDPGKLLVFLNEFPLDILNKPPISLEEFAGEYIDSEGSISDFETQDKSLEEFSKLASLWD